jgi:glucokinase
VILYTYDPEIIVLGGSVRKAFRFFKEAMWESIRSFAFSKSAELLKIEVSELDHVAVLGAAALHYGRAGG